MTRSSRFIVPAIVLLLAVALACSSGTSEGPAPSVPNSTANDTPTYVFFANDQGAQVQLFVEIADTAEERDRGLMFRESLPEDHGMLFKFERETTNGFWMKDTTIPLSIAFISADGVIVDILHMEPLSTTLRLPGAPYLTAVEANQGWFEENGVEVGSAAEVR